MYHGQINMVFQETEFHKQVEAFNLVAGFRIHHLPTSKILNLRRSGYRLVPIMLDKFKDELFKSVGVFLMDIDICYGSPTLYNLGEQLRGGCCHHNSGFGVVPVILVKTHLVQLVGMLRVLLAIGIIKLVFQRSVLLEPLHRWLEAFFFVNDRRQKLLAVTLIV